jgi:hypothetical protein
MARKKRSKAQYSNSSDSPLTQVSVYDSGRWSFAALDSPTYSNLTQDFYLISYKFGILRENQSDPATPAQIAEAGAYIAKDKMGSLTIIAADQVEKIFPRIITDVPVTPSTSASLTDPKFITNIVRKTRNEESNSIQVGTDRQFANQAPRTTIIILDSGVQRSLVTQEDTTEPTGSTPDSPPRSIQAIPIPGY